MTNANVLHRERQDRRGFTARPYAVADLLDPPDEWLHSYDLVVEIITVQALSTPLRSQAIANVNRLVGSGGTLLVIAAVHDDDAPPGRTGPWPLRRDEIDAFATDGLRTAQIEILPAPGQPTEYRWRAEYHRT